MTRETYSLGPIDQFDTLARLARGYNVWRKVARAINKFNRLLHPFALFDSQNEVRARAYLSRAVLDMHLPYIVAAEFALVFKLTETSQKILLTHMLKLDSMTP